MALAAWPFGSADPFGGAGLTLRDTGTGRRSLTTRDMRLDINEDDKAYHIKADIPGVKKDEIQLDVDGDVLSIKVARDKQDEKDEDIGKVKWHVVERSAEYVQRAVRLPDSADPSKAHAEYKDGVLVVDVPKKEEQAQKTKQISVE